MPHSVDKSRSVASLLFKDLADVCGNFVLIGPVFNIVFHFRHLTDHTQIRAAVSGTFQRKRCGSYRTVGVCKRRCHNVRRERAVVTAAVLCVEYKRKIEKLSLER